MRKLLSMSEIVGKRKILGLTQRELATAVEVSCATWINYESEKTLISLEKANEAYKFLALVERRLRT